MKGMITVEASYILPISLAVIGFIFFLGVYQYDMAVMKVSAYQSTMKIIQAGEDIDKEAEIKKMTEELIDQRGLGLKNITITAKETMGKVRVSCTGELKWIFSISLETNTDYTNVSPEIILKLEQTYLGGNE